MEPIAAASKDCETRKVGVWSDQPKHLEKHLREVTYFGESGYNTTRMLEEGNKEPRPMAAILEHVFGPTFLSLYVYKLKAVVKVSLVHCYVPKEMGPELVEEGKAFVNKMLLHRTVGLKLSRVDDQNSFVGRVHYVGDIAAELLKLGLAKVAAPKEANFDAEYFKELKQA